MFAALLVFDVLLSLSSLSFPTLFFEQRKRAFLIIIRLFIGITRNRRDILSIYVIPL